eukprot:CAMPEP_0174341192 /NCGR_PEP_ID=MMETSP0810-20121108/25226_1 /TAXON_ID=73025 ORGANISM="Eutreptiella gymnastica-like, Strain CCMP1594" /NCGR_SAMPLE_ID=MMETSP0810 /ASSEMBLY_ACC=CAM_ASM_000659 /LENGTH=47 /DNA_ID= /DNA_START= /DNA_END= /DNA_ORIENTATION=
MHIQWNTVSFFGGGGGDAMLKGRSERGRTPMSRSASQHDPVELDPTE